jgi:hypothetical protein
MYERAIITICSIVLLILSLAAFAVISSTEAKTYSLTFDGDSTFNDGPITLLIDNSAGHSTKVLSIYGLQLHSKVKVSSTYLSSSIERVQGEITFDKESVFDLPDVTKLPLVINVSVDNIEKGGIFQGRMILEEGLTVYSIPITVSTEPLVTGAILLVNIGVVLSLAIWEAIKLLNQNYYKSGAERLLTTPDLTVAGFSNTDHTQLKVRAAATLRAREQILVNRYSNARDTSKQIILDIGSIVFAIAIGLFSLPYDEIIINARHIDVSAVIVLIGIGMGVGSLREFLERIF